MKPINSAPIDKDCWETPQWLFDALDAEFNFKADLCCTWGNKKQGVYYKERNGELVVLNYLTEVDLSQNNLGTAFMNPPYSNSLPFIKKAYEDSRYCRIVCLLKCDTSTRAFGVFWDYEKHCPRPGIEIRFLPRRIKFEYLGKIPDSKNGPTFASVIIVMDRRGLC